MLKKFFTFPSIPCQQNEGHKEGATESVEIASNVETAIILREQLMAQQCKDG